MKTIVMLTVCQDLSRKHHLMVIIMMILMITMLDEDNCNVDRVS